MSALTFEQWLSWPQQTAFGHAKYPFSPPSERLHDIFTRISAIGGGSPLSVKVVVADQTERDLMASELRTRYPSSMDRGGLGVHHYAELLHQMRANIWTWPSGHALTVICHVDNYYSAAFAVFMAKLLSWAHRPTNTTRLRVLTMSESGECEWALQRAMDYLAPGLSRFHKIQLHPGVDWPARRRPELWQGDTFTEFAVPCLEEALRSGCAAIVHCSPSEANEIQDRLRADHVPFIGISNALPDVPALIEATHEATSTAGPALVVFLCQRSRVFLRVPRLGAVLISGTRRDARWKNGRVVYVDEETTASEMVCLQAQIEQQTAPDTEFRFLVPSDAGTSCARKRPRRRLDHEDSWGFIAAVAIEFMGCNIAPILECFATNHATVRSVMSQLCEMKCLHADLATPGQLLPFNQEESAHLALFLPQVNYDLRIAWFLALGVVSEQLTVAAKRAIVSIAALAQTEFAFLKSYLATDNTRFCSAMPNAMQSPSKFLASSFSMPDYLCSYGIVWMSLWAWHCAGRRQQVFKLSTYRLVHETLEDFVRGCPKVEQVLNNEPLHLAREDVAAIYNVMILSWIHRSVAIDRSHDGHTAPVITDLVARDGVEGELRLPNGTLDLATATGTVGCANTSPSIVIIAFRMDCEDDYVMVSNVMVLPLRAIVRWQKTHGCSFTDTAAYSFS